MDVKKELKVMAEDVSEVRRACKCGNYVLAIANLEHIRKSAEKLLRNFEQPVKVT